jgi:hypothetical protein
MDVSSPVESSISGSWRLTSPLRVGSSVWLATPFGAEEAISVSKVLFWCYGHFLVLRYFYLTIRAGLGQHSSDVIPRFVADVAAFFEAQLARGM